MGGKKGTKTKSKKKKKSIKFLRSKLAIANARKGIEDGISSPAIMELSAMVNISKKFRSARTNIPIVNGTISEARSLETDSKESNGLEAYRFKDQDGNKLIIKNLGKIEDGEYGIVDTIHAIINKANFTDGGQVQVFISTNTDKLLRELEESIGNEDDALMQQVSFVRSLDTTRTDSSPSVAVIADAGDLNNNNAPPPRPKPVMDSEGLKKAIGEDPKRNFLWVKRSEKYKDVVKALDNYQKSLKEYREALESDGDSRKLFDKQNAVITAIVTDLNAKIDLYVNESRTKDSDDEKGEKKDAMDRLKDQLIDAQRDNINGDLERLREAYWSRKFVPLTDGQIDSRFEEIVLGEGGQGEVRSVTYIGLPPFTAGIKLDDPEKWNQEAVNAGIPQDNPEQSKRAVASFVVNNYLKMNVIPETHFVIRTDKDTGRLGFGQAIKRVPGAIGQRKGDLKKPVDEFNQGQLENYKKIFDKGRPDPASREENVKVYNFAVSKYENAKDQLSKHTLKEGKYHKKDDKPVNIDFTASAVQKGLSDLQVLDNIIGHADRHGENIIFETNGENNIILGVKGIDNDDSFGHKWTDKYHPDKLGKSSKTPELPPVIDLDTALKILRMDPADTINSMTNQLNDKLSHADLSKTLVRIFNVQKKIKKMIKGGEMTVATEQAKDFAGKLRELEKLAGLDNKSLNDKIKKWGPDTIDKHIVKKENDEDDDEETKDNYAHDHANSYLGIMMASAKLRGTEPPIFK